MTPRALVLLLIAGATLFAATNVGVGWLYALGFLCFAYTTGAFTLAAWSLRELAPTLRVAPRGEAGGTVRVEVSLGPRTTRRFLSLLCRPLGDRPPRWWMRGDLVPEGWAHAPVAEAPGGKVARVTLAVPAPHRGVYPAPDVVVQVAALGLGAVHRTIRGTGEVLVRPRVHELRSLEWLTTRREPDPQAPPEGIAAGYELTRAVRPYQAGDTVRSVHWRATARTGELRVKETEGDALLRGGLAIALDLGPGHTPRTREHALEVVASLCAWAAREGLAVRLVSQEGSPPSGDLEAQLDWLARLRAVEHPPLALPALGALPTVVVTAALPVLAGAWCLWVGEEAPPEAIACPPGSDLARVLGRAHGGA